MNYTEQDVRYRMSKRDTIPYKAIRLPFLVDKKKAKKHSLPSFFKNESKQWRITLLFILFIFLLEILGLSFSLVVNKPLPFDPLKIWVTPTPIMRPQCVHVTMYFAANGSYQNTGYNEVCQ